MEKYAIIINHQGIDYRVEVDDLERANLLLNDVDAADQYLEAVFENASAEQQCNYTAEIVNNDIRVAEENQGEALGETEVSIANLDEPSSSAVNEVIWTKKKATERDNQATSLLVSLRERFDKQFNDKKTRKTKLWDDIAQKIKESGFNVGDKGGERCRQKFANLQKAYLAYIKNQKTTGTEGIDMPPFFDELHSILSTKHKINPRRLEDSLEDDEMKESQQNKQKNIIKNNCETEENTNAKENTDNGEEEDQRTVLTTLSDTPSTSREYSDRFKKCNRKVTPSKYDEFIKEIKEDRNCRSEEFDFLKKTLKESRKTKREILGYFGKINVQQEKKNTTSNRK